MTLSSGDKIDRVTTSGVFEEFIVPTLGSYPEDITAGPDGRLWFTEFDGSRIGRITTLGVFSELLQPIHEAEPFGIANGPDGKVWFTEFAINEIGAVRPSSARPRA